MFINRRYDPGEQERLWGYGKQDNWLGRVSEDARGIGTT